MFLFSPSYFYKLSCSVLSIRMLFEPIKNMIDLVKVEKILVNYIKDLEDSFPNYALTYTIHAHIHLVNQVQFHGPLQAYSLFFSKELYLT